MKPFIGYPGGKSRAASKIIALLEGHLDGPYCEVFGGGFSLGLALKEQWDTAMWINEYDPDMYSLWRMVLDYPEDLCDLVMSARVTSELFYDLRKKILNRGEFRIEEIADRAIDKLIIHKISYSNMGEMSGSPVGGKNQTGKWKFDVRWKPALICKSIRKTHDFLKGTKLTRKSYTAILNYISDESLVYLDPPYVEAGRKCYKNSFTEDQHLDLAERLKNVKFRWFMTYDRHPLIEEAYDWASIQGLGFKYFMSSAYRNGKEMKDGSELFISNF